MERKLDDMPDKPPPPEGYEIPKAPNREPEPNEQPLDPEQR